MANRNMHAIVGAITSITTLWILRNQRNEEVNFGEIVSTGILGAGAAILPDIFDPPTNPRHRSLGHSMAMNGVILPKLASLINQSNLTLQEKDIYYAILAGYGSHLVLDAGTPAGLPLLD